MEFIKTIEKKSNQPADFFAKEFDKQEGKKTGFQNNLLTKSTENADTYYQSNFINKPFKDFMIEKK